MSAYANDKALWHIDRLKVLRAGAQPAPLHVQLIISDLCNQSCSFCAYRMDGYTSNQLFKVVDPATGIVNNNPKRFIPLEKCREILNDCADMGVKAIQFTGGGEPTVHPDHEKIFQYALGRGLEIALVTNGVRLSSSVCLLLAQATWVRFSLDAGNAETYARMRRASKRQFDEAIRNLQLVCEYRRISGRDLTVGVGFVVNADNWREVVSATRLARDCGADNIRISAIFQEGGAKYFDGWGDSAADLCREAETLTAGGFQVVNMFGDRLTDLEQGPPDYSFCGYQHFTTYIGGDLNVYRCCGTAYNQRGLIGSIAEQSFRQLWESRAKRDDFAAFDATGCARCQFNQKNRAIKAALAKPRHENFV